MKKYFYTAVLVLFLGVPGIGNALSADPQDIHITINSDFTASGTWRVPADTKYTSSFAIPEFKNYGSTGLMTYNLVEVRDETGVLEWKWDGGEKTVYTPGNSGVKNLYIKYSIKSALTQPVAIYEFWIASSAFFNQPKITITYPDSWQLVSVWPKNSSEKPLVIDYPTDNAYANPVLVAFIPEKIGNGNAVEKVGNYTVAGSKSAVSSLKRALQGLGFAGSLFAEKMGYSLPESILVYGGNLTNANVGYEATALAARPNVVLYNSEYLSKESTAQIQTTLIHELAHLVEASQGLFGGAPYFGAWFREGLSVFMENEARPFIYTSQDEMNKDDLLGRTHIFTPTELNEKYKKSFDYAFDGSGYHRIQDSYTHAGVVVKNFHEKAGTDGIRKIFDLLRTRTTSVAKPARDTDAILNYMSGLTNDSTEKMLFPYKDSSDFTAKVATLTRSEYDANADALASSIQKIIPDYFAGARSLPSLPSVVEEPSQEKPSVIIPSFITNLFGGDEKKSNETTIVASVEASSSPDELISTSTGAELPSQPEIRKGVINRILEWFRGLLSWL